VILEPEDRTREGANILPSGFGWNGTALVRRMSRAEV
jgi:hypothetical protein